ncbi:MAG: cupin domain-containing protein [Zetaproteobacteria bacterium]|nr:cupin domain-containing protein [Zetaproteobacteria bacterium]
MSLLVPSNPQEWIDTLGLQPHPEGGYFRETYRAQETLRDDLPARFATTDAGSRAFATAIYFLLCGQQVSHLHRICSDEVWHFYAGSGLTIHTFAAGGYQALPLHGRGAFQQVIAAGSWFGATVDAPDGYALVGCTVAPGFDFADFELLTTPTELSARFPAQQALIQQLCLT